MKRSAIFVFLVLVVVCMVNEPVVGLAHAEEITLTTIIPSGGGGDTVTGKRGAIGTTYKDLDDATIGDNNFLVEGNLGIGTMAPVAALDVTSVTSGAIPPRMTEAQRDAIDAGSPPAGTVIYNTDVNVLNLYDGTQWVSLGGTDASKRIVMVGLLNNISSYGYIGGSYIKPNGDLYHFCWWILGTNPAALSNLQSKVVTGPFVSVSMAGARRETSTYHYFVGAAIKSNGDLYLFSWYNTQLNNVYLYKVVTGPFVSASIVSTTFLEMNTSYDSHLKVC